MNQVRSRSLLFSLAFACALLCHISSASAAADDKKSPTAAPSTQPMGMDPKMMEMMQKAMAPGEQHEKLKQMAGNWNCDVKFKMTPDMPEQTSNGYSKNEMIFGGRFLKQDYGGDFMGQAFHGMGLIGFDNQKKKYCAIWADEMATCIIFCEGTSDDGGKTFTFTGDYLDPMSGQPKKFKEICKIVSADKHVCEWYEQGPDGKEFVSMVITYTKQK
jgi:hypothetical protein